MQRWAARAERMHGKATDPAGEVAGRPGHPTFASRETGGTTGEWDRSHNPGVQNGEIKP